MPLDKQKKNAPRPLPQTRVVWKCWVTCLPPLFKLWAETQLRNDITAHSLNSRIVSPAFVDYTMPTSTLLCAVVLGTCCLAMLPNQPYGPASPTSIVIEESDEDMASPSLLAAPSPPMDQENIQPQPHHSQSQQPQRRCMWTRRVQRIQYIDDDEEDEEEAPRATTDAGTTSVITSSAFVTPSASTSTTSPTNGSVVRPSSVSNTLDATFRAMHETQHYLNDLAEANGHSSLAGRDVDDLQTACNDFRARVRQVMQEREYRAVAEGFLHQATTSSTAAASSSPDLSYSATVAELRQRLRSLNEQLTQRARSENDIPFRILQLACDTLVEDVRHFVGGDNERLRQVTDGLVWPLAEVQRHRLTLPRVYQPSASSGVSSSPPWTQPLRVTVNPDATTPSPGTPAPDTASTPMRRGVPQPASRARRLAAVFDNSYASNTSRGVGQANPYRPPAVRQQLAQQERRRNIFPEEGDNSRTPPTPTTSPRAPHSQDLWSWLANTNYSVTNQRDQAAPAGPRGPPSREQCRAFWGYQHWVLQYTLGDTSPGNHQGLFDRVDVLLQGPLLPTNSWRDNRAAGIMRRWTNMVRDLLIFVSYFLAITTLLQQSMFAATIWQEVHRAVTTMLTVINNDMRCFAEENGEPMYNAPQTRVNRTSEPAGGPAPECIICYDRRPTVALIPCGHTFCDPCISRYSRCPSCRQLIEIKNHIYY